MHSATISAYPENIPEQSSAASKTYPPSSRLPHYAQKLFVVRLGRNEKIVCFFQRQIDDMSVISGNFMIYLGTKFDKCLYRLHTFFDARQQFCDV